MSALCYLLTYIFEALISRMYLSEKYSYRNNKMFTHIGFILSALIQFSVSFIGTPNLNLFAFLLCNFLLCIILFKANFLQSLFNSILLSASMLITELCIFYASTVIFGIGVTEHTTNDLLLWIQTSSAKLLYFLVVYLISKISATDQRKAGNWGKPLLLLLLPVASIVLLLGIVRLTELSDIPDSIYLIFVIATILLLYSNIIVFWVHESQIKTQKENMELKLQKQKEELDTEHYSTLQSQYENSNILIHDIRRHLLSIKEFANQGDSESIVRYIDDLYDEYQIKHMKKYSEHKLINAIINRYMTLCGELGINFCCDIRNIDFNFISDANLTSTLCNLLENAVEASKDSSEKMVELTVKNSNENYVIIQLNNSCSLLPQKANGELITTKHNKEIHGFGIKSIKRIAKEHGGSIDYSFDQGSMMFSFTIILHTNNT